MKKTILSIIVIASLSGCVGVKQQIIDDGIATIQSPQQGNVIGPAPLGTKVGSFISSNNCLFMSAGDVCTVDFTIDDVDTIAQTESSTITLLSRTVTGFDISSTCYTGTTKGSSGKYHFPKSCQVKIKYIGGSDKFSFSTQFTAFENNGGKVVMQNAADSGLDITIR